MTNPELASPKLASSPRDYSQNYFSDLIRSLNNFFDKQQTVGPIKGTTIVLTNLPTSEANLEVGALYNDNGTVKVKT